MVNQYEYICDYCSRSFTRKYNLQNHIENFHLNSTCKCDVCFQTFGTSAGYQLHMSRGHNRKGQPYPECDLCGRIFTRRQNIVSHMNSVHFQSLTTDYRCLYCGKFFTTEWSLRRHVHQIHNPDHPTCNYCKKVFKRQDGLDSHLQTCHQGRSDTNQCIICDKSYANNRNLRRHIDATHGSAKHVEKPGTSVTNLDETGSDQDSDVDYICSICNKQFAEKKYLHEHVKKRHSFQAFYKYCQNSTQRQTTESYELRESQGFRNNSYNLSNRDYTVLTCNVCFEKFYTRTAIKEHKKSCIPPSDVHKCSYCDKLFSIKSSLEFHLRIFHPETQIADSNITSTNNDDNLDNNTINCPHCTRIYYSDKSLKHHMKLKHTIDEKIKCELCEKNCNNKYYYAHHVKMVHNDLLLKCDYCHKQFKSKKNIRRHIELMHLVSNRYKCIDCGTLFKEKRSLRKHIRAKHANSPLFPQCHICSIKFESAKSCKIHLKLVHSVISVSHPCHLCSVSFDSEAALRLHLKTKHMEQIYKCNGCNQIFKGHKCFEKHQETNCAIPVKQLPRCIICSKDYSSRKSLKRHLKKFHSEFSMHELVDYVAYKGDFNVDCEECIRNFNDDRCWMVYQKIKHKKSATVFKCKYCSACYNPLDYAIQRCKLQNSSLKPENTIMSELCTVEIVEEESSMEPESTTVDIKLEPDDEIISEIKVKMEPQH